MISQNSNVIHRNKDARLLIKLSFHKGIESCLISISFVRSTRVCKQRVNAVNSDTPFGFQAFLNAHVSRHCPTSSLV